MERDVLSARRGVVVFVGLLIAITSCVIITSVVIDFGCYNEAARWIPYYPDATVVQVEYDYLRPFGVGSTTAILHSDDEARDVRRWYIENQRALDDEGFSPNLASLNLSVRTDTEEGGSIIILTSECASK